MDNMEIVPIGWISGLYPEACNLGKLEFEINKTISEYGAINKDGLTRWCSSQANLSLQKWDGERPPTIEVRTTKPYFRASRAKKFTTRAIGFYAPRNLILLVDRILQRTTANFVPMSFQSTGRANLELYGRCVVQQQRTIKDHDAIAIIGMTREEYDNTKDQLLALPGILEVNGSRKIHSIGRWNVLTEADIPSTTLLNFDEIINKIKRSKYQPPDYPRKPQRQVKREENIYGEFRNQWLTKTKNVTKQTLPTQINPGAWRYGAPKINQRKKTPQKAHYGDEKSVGTIQTTSVGTEALEQAIASTFISSLCVVFSR